MHRELESTKAASAISAASRARDEELASLRSAVDVQAGEVARLREERGDLTKKLMEAQNLLTEVRASHEREKQSLAYELGAEAARRAADTPARVRAAEDNGASVGSSELGQLTTASLAEDHSDKSASANATSQASASAAASGAASVSSRRRAGRTDADVDAQDAAEYATSPALHATATARRAPRTTGRNGSAEGRDSEFDESSLSMSLRQSTTLGAGSSGMLDVSTHALLARQEQLRQQELVLQSLRDQHAAGRSGANNTGRGGGISGGSGVTSAIGAAIHSLPYQQHHQSYNAYYGGGGGRDAEYRDYYPYQTHASGAGPEGKGAYQAVGSPGSGGGSFYATTNSQLFPQSGQQQPEHQWQQPQQPYQQPQQQQQYQQPQQQLFGERGGSRPLSTAAATFDRGAAAYQTLGSSQQGAGVADAHYESLSLPRQAQPTGTLDRSSSTAVKGLQRSDNALPELLSDSDFGTGADTREGELIAAANPAPGARVVQMASQFPPPGGWTMYVHPPAGTSWPDRIPFFPPLVETGIPVIKHGEIIEGCAGWD